MASMDTTTTPKRPRAPFKTADDFRALHAEEQRRIDRLKSQLLSAEERCNAYVGLANLCERRASIGRALEALLAVPGVQVAS